MLTTSSQTTPPAQAMTIGAVEVTAALLTGDNAASARAVAAVAGIDEVLAEAVTGIPAAFDKTWKPENFEPQA